MFVYICAAVYLASDIEPNALEKFSIYHWLLILLIVLYSIPLLLRIQHCARQAKRRTSVIITWILLGHHVLWLLGTTIG